MVCSIVCSIFTSMISTCSSVGGGGGLPWLLLLLMLRLLVFAICRIDGYVRFHDRRNERGDGENMVRIDS
jgi:hypothetical protein